MPRSGRDCRETPPVRPKLSSSDTALSYPRARELPKHRVCDGLGVRAGAEPAAGSRQVGFNRCVEIFIRSAMRSNRPPLANYGGHFCSRKVRRTLITSLGLEAHARAPATAVASSSRRTPA